MTKFLKQTRHSLWAVGFLLCSAANPTFAADPSAQDDSLALERHFEVAAEGAVSSWGDPAKFAPVAGETIALIGGSSVFDMQMSGFFETRLHRQFPGLGLKVRNIAWQADTVHRQQRPMFFYTKQGDTREGSVPDQRQQLAPGILLLRFGKMESLEGANALTEFETAYGRLLDALSSHSKRIVLVAPEPFFAVGPAGELAAERNEILEDYVTAIEAMATARGFLFADLFHPLLSEPAEVMSRTGIDLTQEGQQRVSDVLADALDLEPVPETDLDLDEKVRQLVLAKNQLWHQYYRPTNWAFLFGDRQHVPSSRDHRDANRRWFVEELNRLPALIAEVEKEIDSTLP